MSETVVGEGGMITAPHRAAADAGAEVLRAGGNALEAMIAAAAAIAVVYPHMNAIGGDAFALIAEPGRPPRGIDACGAAGSRATIGHYEKAGYDSIPSRGADAALTVAGAVSSWEKMTEVSTALGGRMPRRELMATAIRLARDGSAVSRSHAAMAEAELDVLAAAPGFAKTFLVDGKAPEEGSILRQERLADTLEQLSHAGFRDFYRGDVASALAMDFEEIGSAVTREDLARHEAQLTTPLELRLRDGRVFNTPSPTQGLAGQIILGLFDRLDVKRGESFEHFHGLIEAAKIAYRVRDAELADPLRTGDVENYLDDAWLDAHAFAIDRRNAAPYGGAVAAGDTVWMGAIDRNGIAVSFIQSVFWPFGSGVVSARTGVLWQNRGMSFSLDKNARRALAPGRKPFHTLNPPLARFDDGRVMVYGSMGGDAQPQFGSALFTRHARFGMEPGEAVAAPRWRYGRAGQPDGPDVRVESRFDPDVVAALERAGHVVEVVDKPFDDDMGHAGMIIRHPSGRFDGASDPRSDGAAISG